MKKKISKNFIPTRNTSPVRVGMEHGAPDVTSGRSGDSTLRKPEKKDTAAVRPQGFIIGCLSSVILFYSSSYCLAESSSHGIKEEQRKIQYDKYNRIKLLLIKMSEEEVLEIIGYPTKAFIHEGVAVWYYEKIYQVNPIENIYLLFKDYKVAEVRQFPSQINPFYEFEDP